MLYPSFLGSASGSCDEHGEAFPEGGQREHVPAVPLADELEGHLLGQAQGHPEVEEGLVLGHSQAPPEVVGGGRPAP